MGVQSRVHVCGKGFETTHLYTSRSVRHSTRVKWTTGSHPYVFVREGVKIGTHQPQKGWRVFGKDLVNSKPSNLSRMPGGGIHSTTKAFFFLFVFILPPTLMTDSLSFWKNYANNARRTVPPCLSRSSVGYLSYFIANQKFFQLKICRCSSYCFCLKESDMVRRHGFFLLSLQGSS